MFLLINLFLEFCEIGKEVETKIKLVRTRIFTIWAILLSEAILIVRNIVIGRIFYSNIVIFLLQVMQLLLAISTLKTLRACMEQKEIESIFHGNNDEDVVV